MVVLVGVVRSRWGGHAEDTGQRKDGGNPWVFLFHGGGWEEGGISLGLGGFNHRWKDVRRGNPVIQHLLCDYPGRGLARWPEGQTLPLWGRGLKATDALIARVQG